MSIESDRLEPISLIATCSCGNLTVTLSATPQSVHACSCSACQKDSGSAFTYTSFFPESAVAAIEGEHRSWRRTAASGRWIESSFCSRCGNTVFRRWEALPGIFGVPVGCFADPTFAAPAKLYFSSQRHRWLTLPAGVELIAMQ